MHGIRCSKEAHHRLCLGMRHTGHVVAAPDSAGQVGGLAGNVAKIYNALYCVYKCSYGKQLL